MKKAIFYLSLFISIILVVNVIKILITDFNKLTEYGFGYLTGKVVIILILSLVLFVTKNNRINSKS